MFPHREIADSVLLRSSAGELRSTFGDVMAATVSDPLLRPTQMLMDAGEQMAAAEPGEAPLEMLTPDEVKTEYSEVGLVVDEPTPRPVAELKAKHRREQMIRDDVIARGPQGAGVQLARLGVSLAGAAIDPLNIAAAFIPVVREARFAGLAARHGLTTARALTGAIEGTVGAIAMEPLTLALADELALDYSMTDALVNVALGGLLGGGLHVAGGTVADRLTKRGARLMPEVTETAAPQTLEDALRASVAQTAEGRDVTVGPVFGEGDMPSDPAEPFDRMDLLGRTDQDAQRMKQTYDLNALKEFDETLVLPDDLPEPMRAQIEEADQLVSDAENARPALAAAGECLAA